MPSNPDQLSLRKRLKQIHGIRFYAGDFQESIIDEVIAIVEATCKEARIDELEQLKHKIATDKVLSGWGVIENRLAELIKGEEKEKND